MRFIDYDQVVVPPVDEGEIQTVRLAFAARKIRVVENVIAKTVARQDVRRVVAFPGRPVVVQLLRAQHEHALVAAFVVFDNRKRSKGFTQTHAVGKNTPVVLLELLNEGKRRVLLEVVELLPDETLAKARTLVGKNVFGEIFQKAAKDVG